MKGQRTFPKRYNRQIPKQKQQQQININDISKCSYSELTNHWGIFQPNLAQSILG